MPKSNFFVPHSNIHHNKPSTLLRMVCIFSIEVVLLSLIEFNFVFTPTAKAITGGLLHTITPTRIYDSRYSGQGPIHSFEQRTLQVNIAYIHPSTTAIFVNLTIANPVGTGSITTYSGSSGVPSSDSLNWYSGGAIVFNKKNETKRQPQNGH